MAIVKRKNIVLLLALSAIILPLASGCSVNPVTGKNELIMIPQSQEIAMGLQAAPQVETQFGGPVADSTLQSYIQQVGKKVASKADRDMPYDFTVVNSEIPNAFALPGGKIFITAGLMSRMTNERQLAAVLGHEIVHVAAKHGVKGMQRGIGASVLVEMAGAAAGADKAAAAKAASQVAASMVTMKYGRGDEYESDKYGTKYMTKAGYNPWGMVELLTILLNLSKSEPGALQEMFQTHPLSSKRISAVKSNIAGDAMYRGFSPAAPDPRTVQFLGMKQRLMRSATFKTPRQPGQ
jgi:predicted Zn-dependent protease